MNGKEYTGVMHSITVGRIGKLKKLFKDNNVLQEGTKLEVLYYPKDHYIELRVK